LHCTKYPSCAMTTSNNFPQKIVTSNNDTKRTYCHTKDCKKKFMHDAHLTKCSIPTVVPSLA
jgi:hypothetical protein